MSVATTARTNRFGLIGSALGATSAGLHFWLSDVLSRRFPYESIFIDIGGSGSAERFAQSDEWEMKAAPPFPITDENILLLITAVSLLFAFMAVGLAVMAERIGESTLYGAAALMLGSITLLLMHQGLGVFAMGFGFIAMMQMRKQRTRSEL